MAVPVQSFDETLLRGFLARLDQLEADRVLTPVITLDRLRESIDDGQRVLVEQVIGLRPGDYGVDTPYAGDLEPVPSDLVRVSGQQYTEHGRQRTLGDKYVPRHVFEQYTALNDAFADEQPGRRMLIQSCYRSPAYQVAVFVSWLITRYQGDIGQAIRHASPPAYSQHTIASKAAIDFKNVDGSPSETDPGDFAHTAEYAWLREHAVQFQFYESWPPGNEFGMRAEPWHWQYRPRADGQLRVIKAVANTLGAAGISAWLFGGWGLDARIGRITREHGDVEFWVERVDAERSKAVLAGAGATALATQPPEEACEFTWDGVDFSTAYFDRHPGGSFIQLQGRWSDWLFPPGSFGDEPGTLDGVPVLAMSVAGMLAMKEQYPHLRNGGPWRQKDIDDIKTLRGLAAQGDARP